MLRLLILNFRVYPKSLDCEAKKLSEEMQSGYTSVSKRQSTAHDDECFLVRRYALVSNCGPSMPSMR